MVESFSVAIIFWLSFSNKERQDLFKMFVKKT
jgi:hypothetical protein